MHTGLEHIKSAMVTNSFKKKKNVVSSSNAVMSCQVQYLKKHK